MPIYEYKCTCGGLTQLSRKMSECCDDVVCVCGKSMKLAVSLPGNPNFGFRPFMTDNITGQDILVESRRHKQGLLTKYGLEEAG